MANQPSKYSKFLVGAASAALVASAVAPVASAADFKDTKGNTHEEAINALSDAGVIKGYSDGTFLPNKTLTRSDVVKMMGKWLVTEGHAIPADARTNPRFTDLSTKSNAELLDYAAVVKDAGVFIGSNGKLLAVDNITRENMALVLVRAFDTVEKIDLATYVAGQDFKRDVKDLTSAKSEARAAIDVLDFFDITNPTVASFNPKGNTTRGHFATFLHKTINADFSKVAGEAAEGVVSVKAVNATTVEVAFKEDVKDVKTSDYTIEGLAISNAAVKQTDSKVVVLTTAVQTGDKEYTLKSGESALGKFKGISAVVPTKVTINTSSVQGVVGKEVTLKADIGVKEAGVPVTFNVSAGSKLNKDHIEEVTTDANGIATYSYTQYVAGESDDVVAYPTGAPSVRDFAKVYWGVDSILKIEADDKKGDELNNGENKVYKVTYKDAKTGKAVANQKLHVTFAENVDTTIDKITYATVNGKTPYQLTNGNKEVVTVTTNSKGEATLTVSGLNTKATPIVFVDDAVNNRVSGNDTLEVTELQARTAQLVIGAIQSTYDIAVSRDGGEEAATGYSNGRVYKVAVKTKDGKAAANETVNVVFNEDIDRNMNTNTSAVFIKDKNIHPDNNGKQIAVKLDAKGEGSFIVGTATGNNKDYATPVVWLDINTSNAKAGFLDEGEQSKTADMTYFASEKLTSGALTAKNGSVDTEKFTGVEPATFVYTAANQSGKAMSLSSDYDRIDASFTVWNTGSENVLVNGTTIVSAGRSHTVTVNVSGVKTPSITVESQSNKTTSVEVVANGTAIPTASASNTAQTIHLGSHSAKAAFTSTTAVADVYTGNIVSYNKADKEITFATKAAVSYKDASFKNANGNVIDLPAFEALLANNTVNATYTKNADGKVSIEVISLSGTGTPDLSKVATVSTVATTTAAGLKKAADTVSIDVTFTGNVNVVGVPELTLNAGTTATYASGTGTNKLTFTYTVGTTDATPALTDLTVSAINLAGGTITTANGGAANLATAAKVLTGIKVDGIAPTAATSLSAPVGLLTITGAAASVEAGSTVTVFTATTAGTLVAGTAVVAADGSFTWTANTALTASTPYFVEVTDAAGNVSATRTSITTPAS